MKESWICNECDARFSNPGREYEYDDGATATVTRICPYCESRDIERLEPCENCHVGLRRAGKRICRKCELRAEAKHREYARSLTVYEAEYIDDLMDGNSIFDYR